MTFTRTDYRDCEEWVYVVREPAIARLLDAIVMMAEEACVGAIEEIEIVANIEDE